MEVTLSLQEIGNMLLGIAAIVLLVILSVVAVKLIGTLKRANKLLDDLSVVSSAVAEKTKDVEAAVTNLTGAVSNIANTVKGNQSLVSALSALINSIGAFKKFSGSDSEKK